MLTQNHWLKEERKAHSRQDRVEGREFNTLLQACHLTYRYSFFTSLELRLLWQIETLSGWTACPRSHATMKAETKIELKCPKPHNSWIPILPVSFPDSKVSKVSLRQARGMEGGEKRKQGKKERQTARWFKYKTKIFQIQTGKANAK